MTMASGLFVLTFRDALDTSGLAIDLLSESHRIALVTNTYTPNFDTHDAYADITNELPTAGGYTLGGKLLTGLVPTWGLGAAGQLKYDLTTDQSWASASFTARGAVYYADALTNNDLIVAQTFGADFTATNGTFSIQNDALGVFFIDVVP
jgi:hypothetical protein